MSNVRGWLGLVMVLWLLVACGAEEPSVGEVGEAVVAPGSEQAGMEQAENGAQEVRGAHSEEVDEFMASFIEPGQPGGAVLVMREGAVLHRAAYGLADLDTQEPLTPDSIFHIGSVGKQFTGMAILLLAEDGLLSVDDPLSKHLPELASFGDEITLRHLLYHTSGLPGADEDEAMLEALYGYADEPDNEDVLTVLAEMGEAVAEPGEEYAYNNTGYDLLGLVVEQVSGQPFPSFMENRIFGPLGMEDTFSLPNPERRADPRIAHSYVEGDDGIEAYDSDPLDNIVGSGSIYSTVGDMALYDQALDAGKLVRPTTLAEAFESGTLNDGTSLGYGFGWDVGVEEGIAYQSHEGAWLGFLSYYARLPEQQLTVIVLLNRDYEVPDEEIAFKIAEFYLGDE